VTPLFAINGRSRHVLYIVPRVPDRDRHGPFLLKNAIESQRLSYMNVRHQGVVDDIGIEHMQSPLQPRLSGANKTSALSEYSAPRCP
jgi:hypothetical protein